MAKMVIGLCSGSIDRLTATGIITGGAAALDMEIEIYVLLMAARAFIKENAEKVDELSETPHLKDEFLAGLEKNNVKKLHEVIKELKEFTDVKVLVCGTAGKIWGAEKKEDFIDVVDDICGIGEYVSAAEEADVHLFI